ncbi:dispanin subfamily A member 2b-like [Scyliorhinus canicula]|uniref:dispanin subfamily A member 2b-like n=1 Tax=Scyliorhinus canicula TaxID=7830 RepID=UPI0018F6D936|nr:dispanin subfamily A member 2b-like [Scyliorhinus canicula]
MENKMNQPMFDSGVHAFQGPHHTVEVPTSTVTMGVRTLPVKDHILWSIFNFVYCNFCCLGFLALIFSVKSRDRKVLGDIYGAENYSSTSKTLNIAATFLSILVFVIIFGLLVAGVISIRPH